MNHLWAFVIAIVVAVILILRVDLNEFSMNQFYRNRLVRCFLGATKLKSDRRVHDFTGFDFKDDLALSEFTEISYKGSQSRFLGPYPLINCSLNTAREGDLDVQERMAESFILSPLYCGMERRRLRESGSQSERTRQGYRPTDEYMNTGRLDSVGASNLPSKGGIRLGTAVSISGAAASPNSGYHTSPVMAFLMTLFNVRLGWWVPNPGRDEWRRSAPRGLGFFQYLVFELFGSATPNSSFVYLSDGGHFENLGIYELVRRYCRFIIAVDGEQDGDYTFHALGTAIRRCRVDFDAEIEINVDEIRPDPLTGFSRCHGAVGTIQYDNGSSGVLLYLKSSLTGDEGTDIAQYKSSAPSFPHQTTGDQWFNESQFESHRALGKHIAEDLLRPVMKDHRLRSSEDSGDKDVIDRLAEELKSHWFRPASVPASNFVNHTQLLDQLWAELSNPHLPPCLADLMLPNWIEYRSTFAPQTDLPGNVNSSPMPTDEVGQRQVYAYCERLIQLMENVYLDLQLRSDSSHVDNTGWMQLFRQWACHDVMLKAWKNSKGHFGKRFQSFWDDLIAHDRSSRS